MKAKRHLLSVKTACYIGFTLVATSIVLYLGVRNRRMFSRRAILSMEHSVRVYGVLAPLIVLCLIILSTIIPPLPIPIPLLETCAGMIFGFYPGFLLVWVSQLVSSLIAFRIAKKVITVYFPSIGTFRLIVPYRSYLSKYGSNAIVLTRLFMASPGNIISYLAGMTHIDIRTFSIATLAGTLPECLLFPFIGSLISTTQIRVSIIFLTVLVLSTIGPLISYFFISQSTNVKENAHTT